MRFLKGILLLNWFIEFISEEILDDNLFLELGLHDWIAEWCEKKSTQFICGWWLLKFLVDCPLIGGNLELRICVLRGVRANSFRFWTNFLYLVVLCWAREKLCGICEAGSTYLN